jgi:hypothetical protein
MNMGWLASIGVGICSGLVGFVIALFAAAWAVELLRVSQREGAAGFFAFGIAIVVFFAGIVLGIVCARMVPQGASPSFWRALGTASAILSGTAAVGLALAWLLSDPIPKLDGARLELAIELRCPPGFVMPELADPSDAYATIIRLPGGTTKRWSRMELGQSRTEEGRLIVPTLLPLDTSVPRKLLSIRLGKEQEALFEFEFGAKPREKDLQWSRWIEAAYPVGKPKPAPDATFHMRYRVQKEPPAPKVITRAEEEEQRLAGLRAEFAALSPDAPISAWLNFTHYRYPEDVRKAAGAAIRKRPDFDREMSQALRGEDPELVNLALSSFQFFPADAPAAGLTPSVEAVGQEIVASMHAFTQLLSDDPDRRATSEKISRRFSDWMVAASALQGQPDVTFVPVLQEIAIEARKVPDDYQIRMTVLRVSSYYLNKWGGIAPLPSDPPPK